jgi:glycerophosphoryl diester phosphodiesterase
MTARRTFLPLFLALAMLAAMSAAAAAHPKAHPHEAEPLVIGHRGASGYRPEHTLASYELAARQGADFIEPDLVVTKDGVLVARHEPEISTTTDVAAHPEFAARRTTKLLDGVPTTGWFTEDFTLAELKTLRAKERIPAVRPQNATFDGQFEIPTFQEVIDLRARLSRELRREIGIYPETKHPTYFRNLGLPLEERLVWALRRNGLDNKRAPVFVQSFEVGSLRRLRGLTRARLVQLVDARGGPADLPGRRYAEMVTPAGLAEVATYADAVGVEKSLVQPLAPDGSLGAPTALVRDAHRAGLAVHVWTLRSDSTFLPRAYRGDAAAEWRRFAALGVDGMFGDFPDVGVRALGGRR